MASFNQTTLPIGVEKQSNVNMSGYYVGTTDFGRMDVVYHTELVRGDNVTLNLKSMLRAAPMPCPTFGKFRYSLRAFFVPHRILTSPESNGTQSFSWNEWINGQTSDSHPYFSLSALKLVYAGSDSTNPLTSSLPSWRDAARFASQLRFPSYIYNMSKGTTIPSGVTPRFNPFPAAAYQRIFWDWYRDSNLIDDSQIRSYCPLLPSGELSAALSLPYLTPRYCCWDKDYFTTAKLYPQSGASSANIGNATGALTDVYQAKNVQNSSGNLVNTSNTNTKIPYQLVRTAEALQKYLERNNLAGSRLIDRLIARYGGSRDLVRLQMSEYLGSVSDNMVVGDITASNDIDGKTSVSDNAFNLGASSSIMGQQSGKSYGRLNSDTITYHASEFGTLMVISTLVPSTGYYQGVDRSLTRGTDDDKFAYFTPEMQGLGYQPVYKSELYAEAPSGSIFGFAPRYADYLFQPDVVSGDLVLAGTKTGMDGFHTFRQFTSVPTLTPSFTQIRPQDRDELDSRIFSITPQAANASDYGKVDHFVGYVDVDCLINRPIDSHKTPFLEMDASDHKSVSIPEGGTRMN